MTEHPPEERRLASEPGAASADRPEISILIVVYRTPEFLRRVLDSIVAAELRLSYEVIVVDNAPQPGECDAVVAGRPDVIYLPNARNVGFGRACNQAMQRARGRYFLLLNPDMEVHSGALEELHAFLEREPDVGIAAPRLHYGDGRLQESCRTFYTLKIFLLRRTILGRLFPNSAAIREHLLLDWDHESTREVDWCIGACLLVRRAAVEDVGPMDERFFLYFEDVDWCYRMHQRGWRVVYHPAARLTHHYQRASAKAWPSRGLWLHIESTLRYYEKWSFVLYWLKLRGRALRNVALFLGDALMVAAAFAAAYALRGMAGGVLDKPLFGFERYTRFLVFTMVVSLSSFLAFGLYRERLRGSLLEVAFPVARALSWTAVLMMAATFLFSVRIFSRFVVVLFLPLSVFLVTLGRLALLRAVRSVRRRDLNLRRLVILGPPEATDELMARFREHGTFGFDPVRLTAGPAPAATAEWVHRLRVERAQEVLLFEDWAGDVRGVLAGLRQQGIPVRIVPALRGVLPLGGQFGEFMGWPALLLGGEAGGAVRSPAARATDVLFACLLWVLWLVPFLFAIAWRALRGGPTLESGTRRGFGGRAFPVRTLSGARRGHGVWRTVLDWYPSLGLLASGRLGLVGLCPFTEDEYARCGAEYRERPPEAHPGLVGPWCLGDPGLVWLEEWNRRYPTVWSAEGDFRIFWKTVFGVRDPGGGAS